LIKSVLSILNWKKSIRGRIFWSTILSFVLAVTTSLFLSLLPFELDPATDFLFVLLVFLLYFLAFMHPIMRYLRGIGEGIMSIASGKLQTRLPLRQDELGAVAGNINYMAEQLQSAMQRKQQIEMSKMELITHVSHDLRTPLTSIIGYLNLLKNDHYQDIEEHKRYIDNAFNKTQQLKKLIDDLFEYTRLTNDDVTMNMQWTDISGLIKQIVFEFEPIAQENSLTVRTICEPGLHSSALVDPEKLVRAIDNLLLNALKFSIRPGEITVRMEDSDNHISIAIENRGKPIAPEQEARLFDRFFKAEPSRNDGEMPPGAGLGLSIAKHIVELHGGRIELDHRDGLYTFKILLLREAVSR